MEIAATFAEAIAHHARTRPDAIATRFGDRQMSFAELDRLANRIANRLLGDLQPGNRIGYLGKNSDIAVALSLGAAKAGVVLIPVIWRLAPAEIDYILTDGQARMLFVDEHLAPQAAMLHTPFNAVVQIEGPLHPRATLHFDDWIAPAGDAMPAFQCTADDIVLQLYTSGTTGRPKGVMLSHGGLTRSRALIEASGLDWLKGAPGERSLLAMPFGHVAGVGIALLTVLNAEEMVIHREYDPDMLLDAIETFRLKRIFLVPAALQMLLSLPKAATTDFSSLEYFSYGASPIPVALLEQGMARLGCRFFQAYGMTETWGTVIALPPEDHDPHRRHLLGSAGKPIPGVEVRICNEQGTVLDPGMTGEIEIRAPNTMQGYWGNPDATRAALRADGWLRTGDAGMLDAQGYLYVQDRIKDMIITGAENVYPAEVENAIYDYPDVRDVAVIGVPDPRWGEAVKAVVVLAADAVPDAAAIIAHARTRIAAFKCPKSIDFVQALPRNPAGKILRRELREPYWAGYARRIN